MAAPSYSLPSIGSDNSVADPLVRTALSDLKTLLTGNLDADNLAANSVGASELATGAVSATADIGDGIVTDAKLASPNNSTYKTLLTAWGLTGTDRAAATYLFQTASSGGNMTASPTALVSGGTPAHALPAIYFDNADVTVSGLTEKLRLRAQVSTNGTAWSSVTATFGLYPVTFSGGADDLTATGGTVVSGSTVAIANPVANTTTSGATSDFTVPSDGLYVLGVVLSATLTNNAAAMISAQLQTRNVA